MVTCLGLMAHLLPGLPPEHTTILSMLPTGAIQVKHYFISLVADNLMFSSQIPAKPVILSTT
jgi:hypothetical protein